MIPSGPYHPHNCHLIGKGRPPSYNVTPFSPWDLVIPSLPSLQVVDMGSGHPMSTSWREGGITILYILWSQWCQPDCIQFKLNIAWNCTRVWSVWIISKVYSSSTIIVCRVLKGGGIFFRRGSQIYKSASVECNPPPPHFGNKNFMTPPHHRYTLPAKQAKIVLNQSFWTK